MVLACAQLRCALAALGVAEGADCGSGLVMVLASPSPVALVHLLPQALVQQVGEQLRRDEIDATWGDAHVPCLCPRMPEPSFPN